MVNVSGKYATGTAKVASKITFCEVPLHDGHKGIITTEAGQLFQSLANNLKSRLLAVATVAESKVLYPCKWPHKCDATYGVKEVEKLCERFRLAERFTIRALRLFLDTRTKGCLRAPIATFSVPNVRVFCTESHCN